MSTRCMINFGEGGKVCSKIYQHCDGYPDTVNGVLCKLQRFFRAVEKDTNDTRFGDPEYLAAKFLVWAVNEERRNAGGWDKDMGRKDGPLNFLGLGVSNEDHGDVDYIYFVECGMDARDAKGRPKVKCARPGEVADDGWSKVPPSKLDKEAKKAIEKLDKPVSKAPKEASCSEKARTP